MILTFENSIKIPKCPIKEKPNKWKRKTINKTLSDGLILTFEILASKASAEAFICDVLYNYNFPMAKRQWSLNDYGKDPEWYQEDMLNWESILPTYLDDSVLTYCDFGGTGIVIEEDGLQGAINAFKKLKGITSICQSTGWDTTIFNGYIYYDSDYDDWKADIDLPNNMNFQDYEWENVCGTFIQKI